MAPPAPAFAAQAKTEQAPPRSAELPALGYRVAQHVAGHGVATATVGDICSLAATRHGVNTLRAATAHGNAASERVLLKAGFLRVGPADPADLGGKQGTWDQRNVVLRPAREPEIARPSTS
jgi:RimJ/RimL family protein N-acetyltransferase